MSSLRNILQKCGRNASILGGTPLQIQCASTSNPAYSDSICISRQSYSNDANEAPKNANDFVQKYILEMMNAKKSNIDEDQKAPKSFTADSSQNTLFRQMNAKTPIFYKNSNKWSQNIAAAQKASNSSTLNKNFNPYRYYITVRELPKETTPESLREFYSQFGEIAVSKIEFQGKPHQFGKIAFLSQKAMNHALNSLPHCIDGNETKNVLPATLDKAQRTLEVTNLSPRTTPESLKEFYSKFGPLDNCKIKKATSGIGRIGKVTFADQKYALSALNNGPHTIEGVVVDVRIAKDAEEKNAKKKSVEKKGKSVDTDRNKARLEIKNVPEGITEETLCAFYSKYGQVRECGFNNEKSFAFVLFSAVDEVNRAVDDRPHIINGNPLRVNLCDRIINVSLLVSSLPKNIAEESLREEFSKYGKPVSWELRNDGKFNQSGPYGFVTYSSEQEALNALNSGPHTIEGAVVDVRKAKAARKKAVDEVNRAVDDRPHIIDGKPLKALNALNSGPHTIEGAVVNVTKAKEAGKSLSKKEKSVGTDKNILRLEIKEVPEGITIETLIAHYSKYGQVREWRFRKEETGKIYAFVTYSDIDEVNRAVDDRPHIIHGKPLKVNLCDRIINVPLFVGSLPKNVAEETLREEFSKYGKPVYWELRNDGKFDQSGTYGIVTYSSEQEALNALNSGSHTIEGAVVDVRKAKEAGKSLSKKEKSVDTDKNKVRLEINDVPKGITEETLRAYYSKYGQVSECRFGKRKAGKTFAFVLFSAVDEVNRAVDDRPHIIDGKPLKVNLCDRIINVPLFVGSLPENIAKETLHEEFSKYGKLVYWELRNDGKFDQSGPYGFVTYSSEQEAFNALNSGPHTIEGAVVDLRKASEAGKSLSKEKSYN